MKPRYFVPLLGHVLATSIVGFAFVIPGSCIAGINDLTVGFAASILGTCVSYWFGVRTVLNDADGSPRTRRPWTVALRPRFGRCTTATQPGQVGEVADPLAKRGQ